jgi:hypothetical protein
VSLTPDEKIGHEKWRSSRRQVAPTLKTKDLVKLDVFTQSVPRYRHAGTFGSPVHASVGVSSSRKPRIASFAPEIIPLNLVPRMDATVSHDVSYNKSLWDMWCKILKDLTFDFLRFKIARRNWIPEWRHFMRTGHHRNVQRTLLYACFRTSPNTGYSQDSRTPSLALVHFLIFPELGEADLSFICTHHPLGTSSVVIDNATDRDGLHPVPFCL